MPSALFLNFKSLLYPLVNPLIVSMELTQMFIISKVFFGKGKKTIFNIILEVLANTIRQITRERKTLKGFSLFAYGIIACL